MLIAKSSPWSLSEIDQIRREVRSLLDSKAQTGQEKLEILLNEIARLEGVRDRLGYLRRYSCIMFSLIHHERQGGLSKKRITDLSDIAFAILKVNHIEASRSSLSFLYGDLFRITSQIFLKEGRLWQSAWVYQLACQFTSRNPYENKGKIDLSLGLRTLELGHAQLAIQLFQQAESNGLRGGDWERNRIGWLRSLRLSHRLQEASKLWQTTTDEAKELSTDCKLELEWERICLDLSSTQDLTKMFQCVKKGKPHFINSYLIEAFFWSRAVAKTSWFDKIPKMKTLYKTSSLDMKSAGLFYKLAQALEDAYDQSIPLRIRLEQMGPLLEQIPSLRNVDKQLLAWAAATRWLARCQAYRFAVLSFAEYRSLSLRLSSGQTEDVLGIGSDLFTKSWNRLGSDVPDDSH
ncbi:MAG: hypothetical protein ACOH5I_25040 [Oligoflexus sp.]